MKFPQLYFLEMVARMKNNFKSDERLRRITDLLPAGLDPYQTLKLLAEYVRSLEETFDESKKNAAAEKKQMESDYRVLKKKKEDQKQERDRLTADLMEVTNTLEDQDSVLATANQKVSGYEKQLKKLHRETNELANKLTQKENDASFYRQELERSVKENEQLLKKNQKVGLKVEELEQKLAVERETVALHDKEARRLHLMVSESQDKVGLTEQKMEDTVLRYSDEVRRLTDRMNADSQHEVALLRKRVRSSVAPEMHEMDQLMVARLNIDTANSLRSLVGRLVTKLEQAGLDLI